MMKDDVLDKFRELDKAKKQQANFSKLILGFAIVVIALALMFAFSVSNSALDKVVVVERSGEYLKTTSENREKLFVSLVKTTCSQFVYYANSFDRNSIEDNKAKALFLCEQKSANQIFALYTEEKSYYEAIERGVIYNCNLEEVTFIGKEEPFKVEFTSILTIRDGEIEKKFKVFSEGYLSRVTPVYPTNNTGFFFSKYVQRIRNINQENNE